MTAPANESGLALPPGAALRRYEIPGGPLTALEVASTGDGSPVVLLPGFTGSKEDFRDVVAPLAAAGHPALAYDQRGQFTSPGPDDPSAYTVEALAGDLLALLDVLDAGPVHVVGHSFGGLVARAATLKQPEAVRSLVLLCSGPAALTGPRVEMLPLMRPVIEQGGMPALVEAVDALNAGDERWKALPADVQGFLRTRMLASSAAGLLGMADALMGEPDLVAELRASGVPVLVCHGEGDDAWAPALQREMAERLGATYAVVPDALHSPAVENPAATVRALTDFFAGR